MKSAWSYRLKPGMEIIETEQDGVLLSAHPLVLYKLNPTGVQLLKSCRDSVDGDEIYDGVPEISDEKIMPFLEFFVKKGVLTRVYHQRTGEVDLPFVSVVIPVRNRPMDIERCLESIINCHYPSEKLEVIVVDDASTDLTKEAVRQYPVQLIEMNRNVGQSRCRNIGVKAAKGDIIAFTDSDCVVNKDWLSKLTEPFKDPLVGVVGGGVDSYGTSRILDRYEEARSPLHMGERSGEIGPNRQVPYVPTCNVLIRREAFLQVGGFKEEMRVGEDVDLIWRILLKDYKGWYVPEGRIRHQHRNQFLHFIRRRAQYASSEALLEKNFIFNRKKLFVSPWHMINLFAIALGYVALSYLFVQKNMPMMGAVSIGLGLALLLSFISEIIVKKRKIKRVGYELSFVKLITPLLRSHLAFVGYFTAALARYYSLYLFILGLIFPEIMIMLWFIYGLSAYFEYIVKKPVLNYPTFLFVYMIECLSYQYGVFYGCYKQKNMTPLLHQIKVI